MNQMEIIELTIDGLMSCMDTDNRIDHIFLISFINDNESKNKMKAKV